MNVAFFVRHENFLHPKSRNLQEVSREPVHIYKMRHPEALPRALGLELSKVIDVDPGRVADMRRALDAAQERDGGLETKILRDILTTKPVREPAPAKPIAKTSLRMRRPEGEARVTAQDGRVELRLARDFSAVSRADLQKGIEAFLAQIDKPD